MNIARSSRHGGSLNCVRARRDGAQPVVLVHPIGLDLTFWAAQFADLAEGFDVAAYDLMGHGASSRLAEGYTLEAMARDLGDVIDTMGLGSVHVIGHSLGGMVAQTFALSRPAAVRSLVLIDTVATLAEPDREIMRQRAAAVRQGGMEAIVAPTLERWFTAAFAVRRPDVIDRVAKALRSNTPEVHAALWDAIAAVDLADRLPRLECPTLVLVGEQDRTTPPAAAELIASRIPHSHLTVLPGVAHMPTLEAPALTSRMLVDFLTSLTSGSDLGAGAAPLPWAANASRPCTYPGSNPAPLSPL